jgi:alkanesulfonate monooxygenase SsuD/methylene tetrahydromethanopterin reductase-like flavin-dependent oxidoreductase (luciferase family)
MASHSVSIAFQTDKPITAYGPLAEAVEQYGFSGVTVYNDMLYQPAWLPLLEIARHTKRVRIGPAAVNPFTSHPINIAGNTALIDEMFARYISDDILRCVAFTGTPDEVAEQAAHLFDAGVQRVELGTPHGLIPAEGLRLLGEFVLPALR